MKNKLALFVVIDYCIMILAGLITVIPFVSVIAKAFSDPRQVMAGNVLILPKGFQINTILYSLKSIEIKRAFFVSVFVTSVGTFLAMIMTVTTAFPLSKPKLKGRKCFLYLYIFIMLFGSGMIPNYLLYRSLHLINTLWALVFSGAFAVGNMFIVKNYFESLPEAIEEAALIDGASHTAILFRVVLPMSKPVLATITLYYAVGYWNSYSSGILYITKTELRSLQHYLYEIVQLARMLEAGTADIEETEQIALMSSESVSSANIVISTIPILIVYPLLQKHFVKGITIGSVKG